MEKYSPRDVTDTATLPALVVIVVGRSVPQITSGRGAVVPVPSPGLFEAFGTGASAVDLSKSSVNYGETAFMARHTRHETPSSNLP